MSTLTATVDTQMQPDDATVPCCRELKSVVDLAKLYMTNNSQKTGVSEAMETDNSFSEHGYIRGGKGEWHFSAAHAIGT